MQLPQLQITNTFGILGVDHQKSKLEIKQPVAQIQMNNPQAKLEMHKTKSHFQIDQTEAFADANLKHPFRVAEEWVERAKQKALQSISKEVSEGNRLMSIDKQRESAIPQIAKENSQPPPKEITIGYLPKSAENIKFHYQPSELTIKAKTEKLKIEAKTHQPLINFNQGDVQIYVKQKASIEIKAVGDLVDRKL